MGRPRTSGRSSASSERRGGERADEAFAAWRRFFEALAEQRPLVLVFEDLHWADDGLLDFVDHLVDWATGVPLLVVCTARPELLDRRPGWGGGKLNALDALARAALRRRDGAADRRRCSTRRLLAGRDAAGAARARGRQPAYAEQYARLLHRARLGRDLPLPETVQGIIAARLDALPPEEKRLLQDAAVVGKVFWPGALRRAAAMDARGAAARARAQGVRPARAPLAGRRRDASTRSATCSSATSPTGRSRARPAARSTCARPTGSSRSAGPRTTRSCSRTTTRPRWSSVSTSPTGRAMRSGGPRSARNRCAHTTRRSATAIRRSRCGRTSADDRPILLAARARARFRSQGDTAELAPAVDALERVGALEAAAELAAFAANAAWRGGRQADADAMIARGEALVSDRDRSPARAALLAEKARLLAMRQDPQGNGVAAAALEAAEALGLDELRANVLNTLATLRLYEGRFDETGALYRTGDRRRTARLVGDHAGRDQQLGRRLRGRRHGAVRALGRASIEGCRESR